MDQPNRQIPRLIPLVADETSHFELARRVDLFKFFNEKTEKTDAAVAKQVCGRSSENIISARKSMLTFVRGLKTSLNSLNDRIKKLIPEGAAAQKIDIALLDFLLSHTDAPDRDITTALLHGMPLSGVVPQAASLPTKEPQNRTKIEDILSDVAANNQKILRNLNKQSVEDRQLCFDMTINEIDEGRVSNFRPLTEEELQTKILTPRFIVHQSKPRLIDNLKTSRVNETTSCHDTYIPDTLDRLLCQIRSIKQELVTNKRDEAIKAYSFDFQTAYKHIGIHADSKCVANIVFLDPKTLQPLTAEMLCQPFGSTLSPRNWGRVVETLKFLCRELFHINCKFFVDDGFGAEPESTALSAFETIEEFATLLGFKIHPDKKVPPTSDIRLLGARIRILKDRVIAQNPTDRIRKLKTEIARILSLKKLSPAQSASFRGRLGFTQSLMFGRIGRSKTHALIARQYTRQRSTTLNKELVHELKWWFKNLTTIPPRTLPIAHSANHVIYSDASGEGGTCLGTIIIPSHLGSGPWPAYSSMAPEWLQKANIFTLELLAAAIAIAQLREISDGGTVLVFIDNTAAASALIRGTTDDKIPRLLVSSFWKTCRLGNFIPWIEIVASENNPADAPSRGVSSRLDLEFSTLQWPKFLTDLGSLEKYSE